MRSRGNRYLIYNNGRYNITRASKRPKNAVNATLEMDPRSRRVEYYDIIDVVDETTEREYKRVVFSEEKWQAKLDADQAKKDAYALVEYKDKRRREYPKVEDVIEAIFEFDEGRPEKYEAMQIKRAEIKKKYPKPE
jgi:hypothetical protein